MALDRFRAAVAVYGIVRDGDRILLMSRAGSGYHDGELSLPAGHLEGGEDVKTALVRELAEELAIVVDPDDCQMSLVAHRAPETSADLEYVDLFFTIEHWEGTPTIGEPDKCTELLWTAADKLPPDVIEYVSRAMLAYAHDEHLLLEGWGTSEPASFL